MDWIRTGYRTKMRLWADRPDEVEVRWFRAADGADFFPGAHSFTSRDWLPFVFKDEPFPVGEVVGPRSWDPGVNLVGYPGRNFCGRPEAYLTGGVTGLDPEIHTTGDGNAPCCFQPAEIESDELLIGDDDLDSFDDPERIETGGEDDIVAKTPFRGGPKAVLAPPNSTSQVGAPGLVLECITFSNIDSVDHTISMAFGSLVGDENYVLRDVLVPANGWIRWPCMVPLTSGIILMTADVDDVINYMGTGWIYL